MAEKMPTSKDVAKLAGVSQSTVSRVLNNVKQSNVDPILRAKVLKAAAKIGYQPNLLARGMISGKTGIIGLVTNSSIGPFYSSIIMELCNQFEKSGKQCLIFMFNDRKSLNEIINKVAQFKVEGVVITAPAFSKTEEKIIAQIRVPVIIFNRLSREERNTVATDPVKGGAIAAEYLYEMGHRNICYIRYKLDTLEESQKEAGFNSFLYDKGVFTVTTEYIDYTYKSGYDAALKVLKLPDPPSAVFCTTDIIALGFIDAARKELKIKIPEELSILGYDDIDMSSWKSYMLDSVNQNTHELINKTVKMMHQALEGKLNRGEIFLVEQHIQKRGSVAKTKS